jgi:hypothetical protein
VPLGRQPHRQDVVGEVAVSFQVGVSATCRPTLRLVGQHLDPAEAVGVGPHRVVDAGEVDVDACRALLQEVRQQERQLVHAPAGTRAGQVSSFHTCRVRRQVDRLGHELVPGVRVGAALGATAPEQRVQQEQGARHLPAAQVAGGGRAPVVRRQPGARPATTRRPPRASRRDAGLRAANSKVYSAYSSPGPPRSSRRSARRSGARRPGTPPSSTSGARTRGRSGRSGSGGWRSRGRSPPRSPGTAPASGRRGWRCSTAACRARSAWRPVLLASMIRCACGLK